MSTLLNLLLPALLLVFTVPWCVRMLRHRTPEPAVERVAQLAEMTALVAVGAAVMRFDVVPAWSWYPSAAAVAVGSTALCVRWPRLTTSAPPVHRWRSTAALVASAALLVLVMYASLR